VDQVLTSFERLPPKPQDDLPDEPIDSWITPDGSIAAEFRRIDGGYLVRFPDQADFEIILEKMHVRGTPVDDDAPVETLFRNSILPLIGNFEGELHLHGSAVATEDGAIAFMGLSRRGKTTLAGAFAREGDPFLTEDALSLDKSAEGYFVRPQRPVLRLFADSAAHLLGEVQNWEDDDAKTEVEAGDRLPFATQPSRLHSIFLLGPGESDGIVFERLTEAEALAQLIQNAFVLDVEDKPRLRAHFGRIAALAALVPCHMLDYPRRYAQLPSVISAIRKIVREEQ